VGRLIYRLAEQQWLSAWEATQLLRDFIMANDQTPAQDSNRPAGGSTADRGTQGKVQGEGDYEAARRYRDDVHEFLQRTDVDEQARAAAPESAKQERELALAEDQGKDRSKGDDPVDIGLMYPGRRRDDTPPSDESRSGGESSSGEKH
jgi:hypothetical protein